jgi:hypothetical protein
MAPLDKLDDPAPANNSQSTTLKARRPADVKLALSPDFDGNSGKGSVTATITGAPDDGVVLTADYDTAGLTFTGLPTGCSATTGVVTCTTHGPTPAPLTFTVELENRPATFTTETISFAVSAPGYVETAPADNTGRVVLPRLKGNTSAPLAGTKLRSTATSKPTLTSGTATGGAGATSSDTTLAVESATKKANQLLHRNDPRAAKADAPQAKTTKKPAAAAEKGAQGKATATEKKAAAAAKTATAPTPGKSDPGATDAPQPDHGRSGGSQGGSKSQGGSPKDDPSPIVQVIAAVADLLP